MISARGTVRTARIRAFINNYVKHYNPARVTKVLHTQNFFDFLFEMKIISSVTKPKNTKKRQNGALSQHRFVPQADNDVFASLEMMLTFGQMMLCLRHK